MAKHQYTAVEIDEWRKKHGNFIYFNTNDSNMMVPKPFGFSRTFNWAHPFSWIVCAVVIAVLVYSLFFRTPA